MMIYLSGRIKDYPDYSNHFKRVEDRLIDNGFTVINPCTIKHIENATYQDFMRADIKAMLDCDAVLMLDDWELSVGARTEHLVAAMCGIRIFYETANLL